MAEPERSNGDTKRKRTTCGVLVTDSKHLLLGHATRSSRWDVPKGMAEAGEAFRAAAVRELREETGLSVLDADLIDIGVHAYLPGKDLALFLWRLAEMPDPARLACSSMVVVPGRPAFPELDRFGVFTWETALTMVGRNLARVLSDSLELGTLGLRAKDPDGSRAL